MADKIPTPEERADYHSLPALDVEPPQTEVVIREDAADAIRDYGRDIVEIALPMALRNAKLRAMADDVHHGTIPEIEEYWNNLIIEELRKLLGLGEP